MTAYRRETAEPVLTDPGVEGNSWLTSATVMFLMVLLDRFTLTAVVRSQRPREEMARCCGRE